MTQGEHNEFQRSFYKMEAKLDAILQNQEDFKNGHDKLSDRVTAVEAKVNKWGGALSVLLALYVFFGEQIRGAFFGK